MPLKSSGDKPVSYNIEELTNANKTKPKGKKRKRKQIIAIALSAAGKSNKGKGGKKKTKKTGPVKKSPQGLAAGTKITRG